MCVAIVTLELARGAWSRSVIARPFNQIRNSYDLKIPNSSEIRGYPRCKNLWSSPLTQNKQNKEGKKIQRRKPIVAQHRKSSQMFTSKMSQNPLAVHTREHKKKSQQRSLRNSSFLLFILASNWIVNREYILEAIMIEKGDLNLLQWTRCTPPLWIIYAVVSPLSMTVNTLPWYLATRRQSRRKRKSQWEPSLHTNCRAETVYRPITICFVLMLFTDGKKCL